MARTWKKFDAQNMKWISNNLYHMETLENDTLLSGKFNFIDEMYIIKGEKIKLSGGYKIKMKLSKNDDLPYVWETGHYLPLLAKKKGIFVESMHTYMEEDSKYPRICLGTNWNIRKVLKEGNSVENIFKRLIVPYFWFYTYYEKYYEKPWEDLKHDVGILQDYIRCKDDVEALSYMENMSPEILSSVIQQENIPENTLCLCRDKKNPCDCGGMEGFRLLREDFQRIYKDIQAPFPKKIRPNEPCICGKGKIKKCDCGEMKNLREKRNNYSNHKYMIEKLKLKITNMQDGRAITSAKHLPS